MDIYIYIYIIVSYTTTVVQLLLISLTRPQRSFQTHSSPKAIIIVPALLSHIFKTPPHASFTVVSLELPGVNYREHSS